MVAGLLAFCVIIDKKPEGTVGVTMNLLTIVIVLQIIMIIGIFLLYQQRTNAQNSFKELGNLLAQNSQQVSTIQTQHINASLQSMDKRMQDQLAEVYKGLGEMQSLASGVGDLKKILSNVKTRGILGEIQLGAILEQILSREQYAENIATKQGSREVVEFAVKLPTEGGDTIYLPIDSKFPGETYGRLRDAYDSGDMAEINACLKALDTRIKSEAKDIHDKYLDPPYTTDFAILFLPFEGLYAEVVNRGLIEVLQRDYQVNIAGPSTMAAMLNSLQMSFRTFAIQKRSGEVWEVLGAVKTEFNKFAGALESTQNRLQQTSDELDKLVGTRTKKMQSKLKNITELPEAETKKIFDDETN